MIKLPKKNLKKHLRLITFSLILKENKITIILVTQLLKTEELEEVVLVILIFQEVFQIYLRIFLEKDLVEVAEDLESQITVDQI